MEDLKKISKTAEVSFTWECKRGVNMELILSLAKTPYGIGISTSVTKRWFKQYGKATIRGDAEQCKRFLNSLTELGVH